MAPIRPIRPIASLPSRPPAAYLAGPGRARALSHRASLFVPTVRVRLNAVGPSRIPEFRTLAAPRERSGLLALRPGPGLPF